MPQQNIKNSLARPSKCKLQRLVKKIEEHCTQDDHPRCGRGVAVMSDDFEAVLQAIENIKGMVLLHQHELLV